MKRRNLLIFCLSVAMTAPSCVVAERSDLLILEARKSSWQLPQREKLVFRVKWIGIPAGEIVSEITGIVNWNGRQAYRIEATARTTGFCSTLYRVEDRYVSYLDVERLHTLRHEVHRREGGYKKDAVTDYDQEAHKAYFKSATDGSEKVFDIPADTQDTITAAYVARLLPLKQGDRHPFKITNSEKNYDIDLCVVKSGVIKGRRSVLMVRPEGRYGGAKVREGRMTALVDVAPGHLPRQVIIKAPVFTSVTANLVDQR